MSSNTEFDELFALRILFQDEFDNESDIICELNYELIKRGISVENIPNILKQFYESFGINMTIEQINQAIQPIQPIQEEYMANQLINVLNHYINNNLVNNNLVNNNLVNNNLENNNIENNNIENNNIENNNLENNNLENNNLENNNLENYDNDDDDEEIDDNDDDDEIDNDDDDEEIDNEEDADEEELNNEELNNEEINNEEMDHEETNEDTSGNIINFSNNNQNIRNIQLSFFPINSRTTVQYTFNQETISQPTLNNLNTLLGNIINSNPLIILPSFSPNQTISQSLFNPILSGFLLTEPTMDDVVSTLDDSENDKLKVYKLLEKKEEKCSICMCEINIDEEVCDLPCTHTFHNECIQPWLKNYNYKCPVCRTEVGKPKYNI